MGLAIGLLLFIGLIEWDDASYLHAKVECLERTKRIKEAKRLVPYQSVTLCAHEVTVSRDWFGWSCGCGP